MGHLGSKGLCNPFMQAAHLHTGQEQRSPQPTARGGTADHQRASVVHRWDENEEPLPPPPPRGRQT